MLCTGYRYEFPFLDPTVVSVRDNHVRLLYKHMLPPRAPTLALLGIPSKIIPFPQFELQAKYVTAVFSGKVPLPPAADMEADAAAEVAIKRAAGVPAKYLHVQGDEQFAYNAALAALVGAPPPPPWRELMYAQSGRNKRDNPDGYRDALLPTVEQYEAMLAVQAAGGGGGSRP